MRKTRKLCPLCGGRMEVKQEQSSLPYLACEECAITYGILRYRNVDELIESFEEVKKITAERTKPKAVVKVDRDGNVIERYSSISEAAKKNPMSKTSIENRAKGKLKHEFSIADFTFRLVDDTNK